jgi:hypothetical protein
VDVIFVTVVAASAAVIVPSIIVILLSVAILPIVAVVIVVAALNQVESVISFLTSVRRGLLRLIFGLIAVPLAFGSSALSCGM